MRQVNLLNSELNLYVVHGDITNEESDAIVCPANSFLQFNGGAAACILKAGGDTISEEAELIVSEKLMIPTGSVEVTSSGALNSKFIIHAVGPNLNDPAQLGLDRTMLLRHAINNTLDMADRLNCSSISIPAIATGSFGFPKKKCAKIMIQCVIDYLNEMGDDASLKYIRFINNDIKTVEAFAESFDNNLLCSNDYQ